MTHSTIFALIIIAVAVVLVVLFVYFMDKSRREEIEKDNLAVKDKDRPPHYQYTIVFKNGERYNFSGVQMNIIMDETNKDKISYLKMIYAEGDKKLEKSEHQRKFNQSLKYIVYDEILYINEVVR